MKDVVVESKWLIPTSRQNDWHGLAPAWSAGADMSLVASPPCLVRTLTSKPRLVGTQAAAQQGSRTSARRYSSQAPGQTTSTR